MVGTEGWLTLTCEDFLVFLLAEMDIRTGSTMVWTKSRITVRRRHKFLQICLFSLSIPETLGLLIMVS